MHVLFKTRCIQVDCVRILMVFVHGIHKQKEYRLSIAQILTSKYQSRFNDGVYIDCTSDAIKCTGRSRPE